MARLSDDIERFILKALDAQEQVELQRNLLAAHFSCAPSQINYVLATRFTPAHGFRVESRRGGGGFVRVIRIDRMRVEYMETVRRAIGPAIDRERAAQVLGALCRSGALTPAQARLMLAAVEEDAIGTGAEAARLRAQVLGSMLRCVSEEGKTHVV